MKSILKNFFLFCCLLLLGCSEINARRNYLFYFDSTLHFNHSAYYETVKVVDVRADTTLLGKYVNGYWAENINTVTPFNEALATFGKQLALSHPPLSNNTLLVVLRDMTVTPTNSFRISTVYANAEFYSGINGYYKQLFIADSFFEAQSKNEEGIWEHQLENVWYKYFEYASFINPDSIAGLFTYTEETAINNDRDLQKKYPAYTATEYPEGIYFTREEFLNLHPGGTKFRRWFNRDNPYDAYTFFLVNEKGKRGARLEDSSFYAVYDGNWYKSGINSTYKMSKENGRFYFTGKIYGPEPMSLAGPLIQS